MGRARRINLDALKKRSTKFGWRYLFDKAGGTTYLKIFDFVVLMRDEAGNFKNLRIGLIPSPFNK